MMIEVYEESSLRQINVFRVAKRTDVLSIEDIS